MSRKLSAVEEQLEILIIVGPGPGPRTFSVAKFVIVIVRIKSVNTENNHSAGTKYVQRDPYHNTFCRSAPI